MLRKNPVVVRLPAGLLAAGLTLAVAAVVAVVAGRAIYSRAAFGTWDPAAMPARISYCDRTFLPGSHVTRATIETIGNGFGVFPIRQVSSTADGKPIVAKPLPDSVRHMYPNGPPLPCSMSVFVKTGTDDYVAYGLSGGP
ncbi:MAG: hypothetical protein PVSMB9_10750 [Candidatus Dormibacteria bacterium]